MALAISFDGETVPEWRRGYRIAFFPEDGVYDNEDCAHTSAEGRAGISMNRLGAVGEDSGAAGIVQGEAGRTMKHEAAPVADESGNFTLPTAICWLWLCSAASAVC